MRVVCKKENLNSGLTICSRIIGSGNTLPVLNNILLKTDEGRIKISSTNLELAVNTWVGGRVEEEGDITVPARLVNDYVNNVPTDQLTISSKDQTLFLTSKKANSHIKGISSEEFPLIPQITEKVFTKTKTEELARGIKEVVFAASFSETQPEISGILFSFEGKTLTLSATDRYRLAEAKLGLLETVVEERQIIVPARSVSELGRIIAGAGESEVVEIYLSEGQAMFHTPNTELITRLIEGQYPDYQQIIPKDFTTEAEIDKSKFTQALKTVSLFASENNNIEVEVVPQSKTLVVKSQSAQTGDSEVTLEASVMGQKNTIIFNHRYLLECLNNLSEESVILKLIDPSSPAALVPRGRDNYIYIVMPIKT